MAGDMWHIVILTQHAARRNPLRESFHTVCLSYASLDIVALRCQPDCSILPFAAPGDESTRKNCFRREALITRRCHSRSPLNEFSIFTIGLILLTASLVAMISRRLKLPYSVGLVIAGIVLALVPSAVEFPLTRDFVRNHGWYGAECPVSGSRHGWSAAQDGSIAARWSTCRDGGFGPPSVPKQPVSSLPRQLLSLRLQPNGVGGRPLAYTPVRHRSETQIASR